MCYSKQADFSLGIFAVIIIVGALLGFVLR